MLKREWVQILIVLTLLASVMGLSLLTRRELVVSPETAPLNNAGKKEETRSAAPAEKPVSVPVRVVRLNSPEPPPGKKAASAGEKSPEKPSAGPQTTAEPTGSGVGGSPGGMNIVGEFLCDVGFYVDIMRQRGGRVMVYERGEGLFFHLGDDGSVEPIDKLVGDFSPVTRRLTQDYPDGETVLRRMREDYGPGRYEILLLVTADYEAWLKAAIKKALAEQGPSGEVGTIFVRYQQTGSRLLMEIRSVNLGGKNFPVGRQVAI
jgi:hypothetical protein